MFCTECGANLNDGVKFCSQCGAKVKPAEKSGVDQKETAADEKPVEKEISGSVHLPVKIEDTIEVKSAAISSNGEFLAVRLDDGGLTPSKLEVLKTKSGEVLHTITLDEFEDEHYAIFSGDVNAVCSTGQYVSMVGMSSLGVLDIKTGKVTVELDITAASFRSAFSPDSNYLAVAYDSKITVYNVQKGKALFTLTGHKHSIEALAYSHDGNYLVSVDTDKTMYLWGTNTGEELNVWKEGKENEGLEGLFSRKVIDPVARRKYGYSSVAFRPDGKRFATSSKEGDIVIWDTKSGSLLLQFRRAETLKAPGLISPEISICFAPDGNSLIAGFYDGAIIIYNAETGEVLKKLSGSDSQINWAAYSSDSKKFIASASRMVKFWACD